MSWELQAKTTIELSTAEIASLRGLFTLVFHKPFPEDLFLRKYARTCLGYSVHSLMFLDGEMMGAFSAIPVRFHFHGSEVLFAFAVDLMIHPDHRNSLPRFMQLAENLYNRLTAEGVGFVYACQRDEIAQLHLRLSRWRAIGKVHYYVAAPPFPLWAGLRLWNRFQRAGTGIRSGEFPIEKVNDAAFAERCKKLRVHGSGHTYYHEMIGGMFRLAALQAAVLNVKLKYLNDWHEARRKNAAIYDGYFSDTAVTAPIIAPGNWSIYNQYVIRGKNRDAVEKHLTDKGIGAAI